MLRNLKLDLYIFFWFLERMNLRGEKRCFKYFCDLERKFIYDEYIIYGKKLNETILQI